MSNSHPLVQRKKRDLIGFWIAGLINNFGYVVMLSAATALTKSQPHEHHDAHENPALVLLANNLPGLIAYSVTPYFMDYIPYWLRFGFCSLCGVASFLITAFCQSISLRLVGVGIGSVATAFGEITFLAYTSRFHRDNVSSWSSGTGAAGILGSVLYIILVSFLTNEQALLVSSWIPLLTTISFLFIISSPMRLSDIDNFQREEDKREQLAAANKQELPSTLSGAAHVNDPLKQPLLEKSEKAPKPSDDPTEEEEEEESHLGCGQKLRLLFRLSPYLFALSMVYYFEYLINQSIDVALQFPGDPTIPVDSQYAYYQVIYQVGVFISRSSVNLVPIKSPWLLQLLPLFQMVNAAFLSTVAIFDFVPSIWIVTLIIFFEGLLGGAVYVNSFYLISKRFKGLEKEFCLGACSQAYGLSITLSATTGIFYTPLIKDQRLLHGHTLAPTPQPTPMPVASTKLKLM